MTRHSRHHLFAPIGIVGQETIANARVAIVGCGALGSHAAELLARAGVGSGSRGLLRLIDRDYVEASNLQRQALYDESDAHASRPKAVAAQRHLTRIDSSLRIEPVVRDFNASNARALVQSIDLVIDGTDNFRTRFIINDAAVAANVPWIYGGAVASRGIVAMIVPKATPCFRCLMEFLPPIGAAESCDTAGIITPLPAAVASLQTALALRWIVERTIRRGVTTFDLWSDDPPHLSFENATPDPKCRSCGTEELPALSENAEEVVTLCGRNSIQLYAGTSADLDSAASRFASTGRQHHRHAESLTAEIEEGRLTLFRDGRVIVQGTTDPLEAKSIVARYLGG